MNKLLLLLITCLGYCILSCKKEVKLPENHLPIIDNQSFEICEGIVGPLFIGNISATDPDNDDLVFSLAHNPDQLFEISSLGTLTLKDGMFLQYTVKNEHRIIVEVSDGKLSSSGEVLVNVSKVVSPLSQYRFTVKENHQVGEIIGEVTGSSAFDLSFSIKENDNNLFQISSEGVLSLSEGKKFNYQQAHKHHIIVEAQDQALSFSAPVDIIVINPTDFATTWKITSDSKTINIPVNTKYDYDYVVDWGDNETKINYTGTASHTYSEPGIYTISISGNFPSIYFNDEGDKDRILSLEQWGIIGWKSMKNAFEGCSILTYNAEDLPDLSHVTTLQAMFKGCKAFDGDLNDWNTQGIQSISSIFSDALLFNGNISDWDVGAVTDMSYAFSSAESFNGDLSKWNVSSVTNMAGSFSSAKSFNGNIGQWDVSSVINMSGLFRVALAFNQDISNWNVSSVKHMDSMFGHAILFNQNLTNWNVSSVRTMSYMFGNAKSFDGNIVDWNVSSVTNMSQMFSSAWQFNQDISGWDVSNVEDMNAMFSSAKTFNYSLGSWDISSVKIMQTIFSLCGLSTENYDQTLKGWSELSTVPVGIYINAQGLTYCDTGEAARDSLSAKGWVFDDDSKSTSCN